MILKHERFSKFMRNAAWMRRVRTTVIDEAHCIKHWGETFRKDFDELGKMRSFMTITTPFLIASATLTPALLDETLDKLEYNRNRTFKVNLGNDRPNITPIVGTLPGGKDDLEVLADLALRPNPQTDELEQSIIYVNSRDAAKEVAEHLQSKLPPEQRDQVEFLHSFRHPLTKRRVMRLFREGKIRILVSTEVAGMVSVCISLSLSDYIRVYHREWIYPISGEYTSSRRRLPSLNGCNISDVLDGTASLRRRFFSSRSLSSR